MNGNTAPHQGNHTGLAVNMVAAYVSNNSVPAAELTSLISNIYSALSSLDQGGASKAPEVKKPTSAQIRKSVTPDALISFIDGKPYKTLKRHLSTHGMTFEEYQQHYGLPRDYPSVAASYSEQRSALAKSLGLGQQRRKTAAKSANTAETVVGAPKKRGPKKGA
jgi:predicted transcriptional regulator